MPEYLCNPADVILQVSSFLPRAYFWHLELAIAPQQALWLRSQITVLIALWTATQMLRRAAAEEFSEFRQC
ncbi:hypothetical protein AOQ71_17110 [Bradyrhizobium manausense]|uniref:Uncharacterized protein n=1 Tax=Bradyrhizobium manausense TaxID=989370 RepID=A0A0R3DR60_9BRAD|nr:hypothetical protein AOQ71_17110 [Bradyrhizobium manausense]